ncbi:AAA family ATPase [Atopobacter phocae]|uniref:AAA family ATPase n=1 Tax=Atopobacter phocae TaxID=136492 RepID=UPI00046EF5D6|nr:AAA family ATPase [Atopobacter phocae]
MKIKLNKMNIRNFKGIKQFTFVPNGQDVSVYGDNGTGKTSLYDAFIWCLFGKDSTDKTQFDWKPLDKDNNEIHHLETGVELELDVDGAIKTLERVTKERWTKKRGSITSEFDGHTTTYSIDGLEVTQRDYKSYLSSLIDEKMFRMLTSVTYFAETMNWKERRKALIDMVGEISDEDILNHNDELRPLSDLLKERTADDLIELTKQSQKKINQQIKGLPARIDEVDRSLPDISQLDKKALNNQLETLEQQLNDKQSEVADLKNGSQEEKLKQEKRQLELTYLEAKQQYREETTKSYEQLNTLLNEVSSDFNEIKRDLVDSKINREALIREIKINAKQINSLNEQREKLLEDFYKTKDKQIPAFDEHQTTCPVCGQDYPEEKVFTLRQAYEKEVETFNQKKAERLATINKQGIQIKKEIKELEEINVNKSNEVIEKDDNIDRLSTLLKKTEDQINHLRSKQSKEKEAIIPFDVTEEAIEIHTSIKQINQQIDLATNHTEESIQAVKQEMVNLNTELSQIKDKLYQFVLYDKQKERMNELIDEEKQLSLQYGELEQRYYLLEEFIRTKVNLLTDTINQHFSYVQFKLFDTAINGGLVEVCEPIVKGANYSTGLNNAARINAGLDIINTLMRHYKLFVPIFVDNAESVNEFIPIDTQLITLTVSKDSQLKVEGQ